MRRKTPFDWLIVGLGNPGKDYARTRHNVGQEVVAELARRRGDTMKSGRDNALVAESRIGEGDGQVRAVLAFPLTYMNDSGQAVRALVRRYGIDDPSRIVIVQDELDLPPTIVRIKAGGGLAGHNGLRSIAGRLGTQEFLRLRVGIGRPGRGDRRPVADYVLSPFDPADDRDAIVGRAADAVESILRDGLDATQRAFNDRAPA